MARMREKSAISFGRNVPSDSGTRNPLLTELGHEGLEAKHCKPRANYDNDNRSDDVDTE